MCHEQSNSFQPEECRREKEGAQMKQKQKEDMRTRHKPYSILCPNASPPSLPSPFFPNLQSSWAGAPLGQPSYFANWGKGGGEGGGGQAAPKMQNTTPTDPTKFTEDSKAASPLSARQSNSLMSPEPSFVYRQSGSPCRLHKPGCTQGSRQFARVV